MTYQEPFVLSLSKDNAISNRFRNLLKLTIAIAPRINILCRCRNLLIPEAALWRM